MANVGMHLPSLKFTINVDLQVYTRVLYSWEKQNIVLCFLSCSEGSSKIKIRTSSLYLSIELVQLYTVTKSEF